MKDASGRRRLRRFHRIGAAKRAELANWLDEVGMHHEARQLRRNDPLARLRRGYHRAHAFLVPPSRRRRELIERLIEERDQAEAEAWVLIHEKLREVR